MILPFLGEDQLYKQYTIEEPWNGPNNLKLADLTPSAYRCPSFDHHRVRNDTSGGHITNYVAIVGPGTLFNGPRTNSISDVLDGVSNTVVITEVANDDFHWMQPRDLRIDDSYRFLAVADEEKLNHPGGAQFLLANGDVRFISRAIPRNLLGSLTTIGGKENLEPY